MKNVLKFLSGAVLFVVGNLPALSFLPHGVQSVVGALGAVLGLIGIHGAATSGAPGPAGPVTVSLSGLGKGWKTLVGALLAALGYLLSPDVYSTLSSGLAHVLEVVGALLTSFGLFHAAARGSGS